MKTIEVKTNVCFELFKDSNDVFMGLQFVKGVEVNKDKDATPLFTVERPILLEAIQEMIKSKDYHDYLESLILQHWGILRV